MRGIQWKFNVCMPACMMEIMKLENKEKRVRIFISENTIKIIHLPSTQKSLSLPSFCRKRFLQAALLGILLYIDLKCAPLSFLLISTASSIFFFYKRLLSTSVMMSRRGTISQGSRCSAETKGLWNSSSARVGEKATTGTAPPGEEISVSDKVVKKVPGNLGPGG